METIKSCFLASVQPFRRLLPWTNVRGSQQVSASPYFTLIIEEFMDQKCDVYNEAYEACEVYLYNRLRPTVSMLKAMKSSDEEILRYRLSQNERFDEVYEDIEVHWNLYKEECMHETNSQTKLLSSNCIQITFHPRSSGTIEDSLPTIFRFYNDIVGNNRGLNIYYCNGETGCGRWKSKRFSHPSTFETLGINPDLKNGVIEFLNAFRAELTLLKDRKTCRRIILVNGPPSPAKAGFFAAMANYIHFDLYVLQTVDKIRTTSWREHMFAVQNNSILVIEEVVALNNQSLSEIYHMLNSLNFSFGDGRIVIISRASENDRIHASNNDHFDETFDTSGITMLPEEESSHQSSSGESDQTFDTGAASILSQNGSTASEDAEINPTHDAAGYSELDREDIHSEPSGNAQVNQPCDAPENIELHQGTNSEQSIIVNHSASDESMVLNNATTNGSRKNKRNKQRRGARPTSYESAVPTSNSFSHLQSEDENA